ATLAAKAGDWAGHAQLPTNRARHDPTRSRHGAVPPAVERPGGPNGAWLMTRNAIHAIDLEPIAPTRPAAPYIGGKRNLAKRLVPLIGSTPHTTYAEVF